MSFFESEFFKAATNEGLLNYAMKSLWHLPLPAEEILFLCQKENTETCNYIIGWLYASNIILDKKHAALEYFLKAPSNKFAVLNAAILLERQSDFVRAKELYLQVQELPFAKACYNKLMTHVSYFLIYFRCKGGSLLKAGRSSKSILKWRKWLIL